MAKRAGISRSAVRHYFPTKEGLLAALFDDVLRAHRAGFEQIVLEPGATAAVRLTRIVEAHLDAVATVSDSTMFEVFAFWARNASAGAARRGFHAWLVGHYADAIRVLRPDLSAERSRRRAAGPHPDPRRLADAGSSRPHLLDGSQARLKEVLVHAVDALVGVELPWSS